MLFETTFLTAYRDYVPLVNLIGVFFQIRDDLMNLQSSEVGDPTDPPLRVWLIRYYASTHRIKVLQKIFLKESSPSRSFMEYM